MILQYLILYFVDTLFPKKEDAYERDKRNTYTIPSTTFTIELAVYTDAAFTAIFSYTDVTRRIAAMATKYNGVRLFIKHSCSYTLI